MDQSRPPISSRYNILRVIDRGGYAVVYEAEDRRLRRTVAVKMGLPDHPDPQADARLTREAHVMASITHPNVCSVSDLGTTEDGRPYFVMDRLQGETLRGLLNRELVVEPAPAIDIMLELLSALHAVHAVGTVHRDVKPENIFLASRNSCHPVVKLLDFGCCGSMAAQVEDSLTRDWHVVGTAAYMAPEQAAGSRMFHAGIDLFAAALVLLEMLTGYKPQARSPVAETFPSLSSLRDDMPPALDAVLSRALSPDPRMRYRSTVAFAKDLLEVRGICHAQRTPPLSARMHGPPSPRPRAPSISEETPLGRVPLPPMRPRTDSYTNEAMPRDPMPRAPQIPPMRARAASHSDGELRGPKPSRSAPNASELGKAVPAMRPQLPTVEDPTLDDVRQSVKMRRSNKDTIREVDDEDTPQAPMRSPLRALS